MTADIKGIQGIIWDLDGTLYRFSDLFKTACNHAAARAVCAVRPDYAYEYAFEQSVLSEQRHGFSLQWFHQETGTPFEDMHFVYHDSIDETVIERNEAMADALQRLERPYVLLTNASRGWASRILAHLSLKDLFVDEAILALEDAGFEPKGRSSAGFLKAQALLNLPAENILVVEDLPRNLERAKSIGLKTALVHHGQIPNDRTYIDFLFRDTLECLNALTPGA